MGFTPRVGSIPTSGTTILRILRCRPGDDAVTPSPTAAPARAWIEHSDGSYTGVMGLPLFETARLLSQAGIKVL